MTQIEYEQKKREFKKKMLAELFKTKKALVNYETDIFNYTFDRAYALGRQTKDAEGEETVACPKKLLHQIFACNESILQADPDHSGAKLLKRKLLTLFGARCVPHNVDSTRTNVDSLGPKPAGPTFTDDCQSQCKSQSRNLSQETANCDKYHSVADNEMVGAIISNGFSNLRRLNIAATLLAGILARETPCRNPVKRALELADALINQAGDNTSTPSSLRFECNEKK